MHVVDEPPPPVDLHDGDPLPVGRLELAVPVDRDLPQLEAELVLRLGDDAACGRTEVAPGRGEEDDLDAQRSSSSLASTEWNDRRS